MLAQERSGKRKPTNRTTAHHDTAPPTLPFAAPNGEADETATQRAGDEHFQLLEKAVGLGELERACDFNPVAPCCCASPCPQSVLGDFSDPYESSRFQVRVWSLAYQSSL